MPGSQSLNPHSTEQSVWHYYKKQNKNIKHKHLVKIKGAIIMIIEAISKLIKKEDLTGAEAEAVMEELMTGKTTPSQTAAYLTALHMKGETIEEITASAVGMRNQCTRLEPSYDTLEIVGTGGDCAQSINISTTAALIVAATGNKVTKHGNRAASSKCGAADVLEALGVNLNIEPEDNLKVLDESNFCFMFAQKYHASMRFVGPTRKEIKTPTIFNILGPLANPAFATLQLLGVYSEDLLVPLAKTLSNLGVKRGMVVYGTDGLDEISIGAPTKVCEFGDGKFDTYEITPEQFGFKRATRDDLKGGDPKENAAITKAILSGTETGAKADAVIFNAGAALHITNNITIEEGIKLAKETITNGSALKQLEKVVESTNK